ncbi:unnamed protein product [Schistosoma turkestanicum]|nr:unnamed protein product [Schistosoma turkestanicum]
MNCRNNNNLSLYRLSSTTSSSIICESFNPEIPYSSELTSIDSTTTTTTTPIASAASTLTSATSSSIIDPINTDTILNDVDNGRIHENNNLPPLLLPVRCKSLEIKSTEKSLLNSTSKKRHRSTVDNQWSRLNPMNTMSNLKYPPHHHHHVKNNLCLTPNGECNLDVKKRRTGENNILQTGSIIPEQSVYNYTTDTKNEYEEFIPDYSLVKSFHQPINMPRASQSHQSNSCEQIENSDKPLTNELFTNHVSLKQAYKKGGATFENISTTVTNNSNNNHNNTNNNAFNGTMNMNCHEYEIDNELSSDSELTTAAYNNFVRRVVDDTLDRTVTFCEQPRHAITALENICTRAWPQLEVKRHRNRIRAYLKACRRNSKKNKGQINMKEPPANGLSIEARQLVSKALNLVANDLDYLRQTMQAEKIKNDLLFSSKLDNSNEKSSYTTTILNHKQSPSNYHYYSSKKDLSTINSKSNFDLPPDYSHQKHDQYELYSNDHSMKVHNNNNTNSNNNNHNNNYKNLWNVSNNLLTDIINHSSFPFTDPLFWSNSLLVQNTNLDGNYLATAAAAAAAATAMAAVNPANLLKLLPAAIQLNNNNNNNRNDNNTYPSTTTTISTTTATTAATSGFYSSTTSPFTMSSSSSGSSIFSNSPRLLNHDNGNNISENTNTTHNNNSSSNNNNSIDFDMKHDKLTTNRQGKYSTRHKLSSSRTTLFEDDQMVQANNSNNINNGHSTSPKLNEQRNLSVDRNFSLGSAEIMKQTNFIDFYRSYLLNDSINNTTNNNNINNSNNTDFIQCSPPPAHISSIQYSPIINQILDKLTDSSLLTHEDVDFFLKNLEITKTAIKQARCRSNLILKKIEILENQIQSTSINSKIMPLNLS